MFKFQGLEALVLVVFKYQFTEIFYRILCWNIGDFVRGQVLIRGGVGCREKEIKCSIIFIHGLFLWSWIRKSTDINRFTIFFFKTFKCLLNCPYKNACVSFLFNYLHSLPSYCLLTVSPSSDLTTLSVTLVVTFACTQSQSWERTTRFLVLKTSARLNEKLPCNKFDFPGARRDCGLLPRQLYLSGSRLVERTRGLDCKSNARLLIKLSEYYNLCSRLISLYLAWQPVCW